MARREEEEYSTYCDDEQRSQPGCIDGQIVAIIFGRALRTDEPEKPYRISQKP
jgi:hypothetical protein